MHSLQSKLYRNMTVLDHECHTSYEILQWGLNSPYQAVFLTLSLTSFFSSPSNNPFVLIFSVFFSHSLFSVLCHSTDSSDNRWSLQLCVFESKAAGEQVLALDCKFLFSCCKAAVMCVVVLPWVNVLFLGLLENNTQFCWATVLFVCSSSLMSVTVHVFYKSVCVCLV